MLRPLLLVVVVAAAATAAALPACNAEVVESCTGGPCGGAPGVAPQEATCDVAKDAMSCPATPQTGDFPCDIFAVIHKNCNPCHQGPPPLNGAPFPLLAYADTQMVYAPGFLVFQQMFISTGPDGSPRMPFGGMLEPADCSLLRNWLGNCAPPVPAGTGCGCVGGQDDAGPGCN